MKCPQCKTKLSAYCTKLKKGKKIKYYKCDICGNTFRTLYKIIRVERILKE